MAAAVETLSFPNIPRDTTMWIAIRDYCQNAADYYYSRIDNYTDSFQAPTEEFKLSKHILCKFYSYVLFRMISVEENYKGDLFNSRLSKIYGEEGISEYLTNVEYLRFTHPETLFIDALVKNLFNELNSYETPPIGENEEDFISYNPINLNRRAVSLLSRVIYNTLVVSPCTSKTDYPYLRYFLKNSTTPINVVCEFRMMEVIFHLDMMDDYTSIPQ
jgi:hypothetical protein